MNNLFKFMELNSFNIFIFYIKIQIQFSYKKNILNFTFRLQKK